MNEQLPSQQIAGQFYQQAEAQGNTCQMALTSQQAALLTRTYETERRYSHDSVDSVPGCSMVIDGRTLGDYDFDPITNIIRFMPRHQGTIAEALARFVILGKAWPVSR